ncbi:MAG TPA: class I SAM-dependent methyltransferase [Rhizomicrobium sp.]|jgi:ubiquinone/menaquinone biosynthesis C-methylase UbiE
MTPYRFVRRAAGRILRAIPWTRRNVMMMPDYTVITIEQARERQKISWHSPRAARLQDLAYEALIADMHAGKPRIDLDVAAKAVDAVGLAGPSLIEIGCGSGYYSEILATLARSRVDYTGIDYSAAMIGRANEHYPDVRFEIGDATALRFPDGTFDIAFNGVSLMHILDYEKAIAESARVARAAAVFHSAPVFPDHPTTFLHKYAYGGPMVEAVFNRQELLALFDRYGLRLVQSWRTIDYDVGPVTGSPSHAETFLCEKTQ